MLRTLTQVELNIVSHLKLTEANLGESFQSKTSV